MKYIKSICYSGFRENQHPGWGVYPSYEEIREDLHILVRDGYRQIRMYDPNVHAIRALEIIKEDKLPLKVMLGLGLGGEEYNEHVGWGMPIPQHELDKNIPKNEAVLRQVIDLANQYPDINYVSAGNENTSDWNPNLISVEKIKLTLFKIKKWLWKRCENHAFFSLISYFLHLESVYYNRGRIKMVEIDGKKVKLFALSGNRPLAEEIAKCTNIPLSNANVVKFADEEMTVSIEESVRGCHVFIVQATSSPVNEHYMELFIMIDALKRASAASINVIMPYYGYSRQDRKSKSREPITAKLIADMLQTAGATRVICMDLHAGQIQGFFDIPIDNFPAAPLLASYFKKKRIKDLVIVSPDHGGATRARKFSRLLGGVPLAIIDKRRPEPNVAEVVNIIGEVRGKTAIIVDDIIDTAGTLIAASTALLKAGALEVYAAATHPILSHPAIERIDNSCIKEVVVTNTIELPEEKRNPKITQLSVGPLLGETIIHLMKDEAISQIFNRMEED